MESDSSLLFDVSVAFAVALAGGWLATRLRLPAIVGYIAAGLVISPLTPGFVGDLDRLRLLADIGVVLLLFAIGVQFTIGELAKGGPRIAVITGVAFAAGMAGAFAFAPLLGWSSNEAAYVGAAAAICSSVVLVTLLERRGEVASAHGRIAIGIAVVQDLLAVVLIIVLEAVTEDRSGGASAVITETLLAAAKAAAFVAGVLIVGIRVVPWILNRVAEERSRELFFIAVTVLVIGTALASDYIGLSIALGAFLAGIVVSESDLSHRVLGELLPIRDVFAVLFFVTAGMLVDPQVLISDWPAVVAVCVLILGLRPLVTGLSMRATRFTFRMSVLTAAVTAQSAEFTFLLAGSGLDTGAIDEDLFSAILAGAVISIIASPLLVLLADRVVAPRRSTLDMQLPASTPPPSRLGRRAIVCGYGGVGQTVAAILKPRFDVLVIEDNARLARQARDREIEVVEGNPTSPAIIERACIEDARVVVIALDDPFAARLFAERVRAINPHVDIVARAVIRGEAAKLERSGVTDAVVAEEEVAFELARYGLHRFGLSSRESLAIIQKYRARARLGD